MIVAVVVDDIGDAVELTGVVDAEVDDKGSAGDTLSPNFSSPEREVTKKKYFTLLRKLTIQAKRTAKHETKCYA